MLKKSHIFDNYLILMRVKKIYDGFFSNIDVIFLDLLISVDIFLKL